MLSPGLLAAILPLVVLELGLKLYCFFDWRTRTEFGVFTKNVWILIILLVNTLGPVIYLLIGRSSHERY